MKRQAMVVTIQELKDLVKELEDEIKSNENEFPSGFNTKFQINIINESAESDNWRFE